METWTRVAGVSQQPCWTPAKNATSPWGLDSTTLGQMASPRYLRDYTHLTFSHSLTHPCHPFNPSGAQDRCGATYLLTQSHSSTSRASPSTSSSASSILFFSYPKKERPFRLSVSSLPPSPLFQPPCLGGDWASTMPRPRSILSLRQSGVGWTGSFLMLSLRPMVPPPLRWNPFLIRLLVAGPVELLHMLYRSPTCSAHQIGGVFGHGANPFDLLFRGFSLPAVSPLDLAIPVQTSATAPGPAFEGGRYQHFNCNGIQQCHAEL